MCNAGRHTLRFLILERGNSKQGKYEEERKERVEEERQLEVI